MSLDQSPTRKPLIETMRTLQNRGIDCSKCSGECCTYKSNSMQITLTETQTIFNYLTSTGLWNLKFVETLESSVKEFRLDVDIPQAGSRPNLRRTYTCPFYTEGPTGCRLPFEVKPHGCLAFNPVVPRAQGLASGCRSHQEALRELNLPPEPKAPIPLALLQMVKEN